MSSDLKTRAEKQNEIIELLQEELRKSEQALEERAEYACLVRDLDNAVIQMQMDYLQGRT